MFIVVCIMFSTVRCWTIVYQLVLLTFTIGSCADVNVTIALNKTLTENNRELYGNFTTIGSNSTVRVTLSLVNKDINFIVFQAHSHLYNIVIYNNTYTKDWHATGTNIGLYGAVTPTPDTYFIYNRNGFPLKVFISIHGYKRVDPIPGGCNMELPTQMAAYLNVSYTRDMVSVGAPGPKEFNVKCPGHSQLKFYRMYMSERNFDEDTYFESIRMMLTKDKIEQNGDEIDTTLRYGMTRRLFSAYPGTGAVYAVIAMNSTVNTPFPRYSIYVPSVSYGCSPIDGCELLDDITSQFFCAGLLFVGLFVCFFGHRFFKTEMFLVGMFAGIIFTYTLIPLWADLDRPALLGASVLSGIFFGAIWLLLWWFYGIPVVSVLLCTMQLGFLIAAIVYYKANGFQTFTSNDGNFWMIFVLLILMTSLILSTVTYVANIMACAVLGSYAAVFAIDHYMGSNLKYIMINTMRRASVFNFKDATLSPPFQWRDGIATFLWISLAGLGFTFQHYHNRGRPPFPPPPRSLVTISSEDINYGAVENGVRRFRHRIVVAEDSPQNEPNERTRLIEH